METPGQPFHQFGTVLEAAGEHYRRTRSETALQLVEHILGIDFQLPMREDDGFRRKLTRVTVAEKVERECPKPCPMGTLGKRPGRQADDRDVEKR